MDNYTRTLLGLTDKNFIPEEHCLRNTNICDTNQCQYNLWDNWLVHKTV